MAEYIRIGKPANDAEREGIRMLRDALPEHYLILGNFSLRLPQRRNSLEFDAVVIGEYGFFAVEIKGWSGQIRGGDRYWYLPWGKVDNPLNHLEKKTKALAHYVRSKLPNLPNHSFYAPAVFFPRPGAKLDFPNSIAQYVVRPEDLYNYFVDEELMRKHGPGPFRSRQASQMVVDAIVAFAEPLDGRVGLPSYKIEGELECRGRSYREFVGAHKYMKSRPKVRIKAYTLDGLASPRELRDEQNRILRDLEALEVLNSEPYVARSHEMQPDYKDDMIIYLVSEWVGRSTLGTFMEEAELSESRERRHFLASHLVEAVHRVHQAGIVHRNLNPEVIYLTDQERPVPLKLADFEFARVAELESIADAFSHIGTEGYKAPELWMETDYDHNVDLFSLGAILYELLVGRTLFDGPGDIIQIDALWQRKGPLLDDAEQRAVIRGLIDSEPAARSVAMEAARRCFPLQEKLNHEEGK